MSSPTPPSTLGKYQIIREIARSNDIVYEAYDPQMDRRVALKELNIPNGSTPQQIKDRIDRFEREARAAGRLSHPNIMTVYDVDVENERHFMSMEFLDGHTLRNELDTNGALGPERAIEVAKAILSGLQHAHDQGVIHRDIKPENIQILSNGQIKITDFGIARLTFQPNITMDGQVFGTPSYMSPEQVKGGDLDSRSDLFSVGVLLYEMIAGQKPFQGDSVISITYAIMNAEPVQPSQCSFGLWQVIQKALDKSPMLRFSSASEMSKALDEAGIHDVVQPYGVPSYPAPQFQLPGNPYGIPTQAPGAPPNPYGIPYGNQTQQNPYHDPFTHQNTNNQPLPPTYVPYPIFVPPPKKPLIKPEYIATIRKIFFITLLVGTFMGLVVALLSVIVPAR